MQYVCAWEGCKATTPLDQSLPDGWRWLLMWWSAGSASSLEQAIGMAERDCVLCPEHASQLHNVHLKDIGQWIRNKHPEFKAEDEKNFKAELQAANVRLGAEIDRLRAENKALSERDAEILLAVLSTKTGYGVTVNGDLEIRTVSPTERGAMVNALYIISRMPVMNDWSDEEIKRYFEMNRQSGWELVSVEINF